MEKVLQFFADFEGLVYLVLTLVGVLTFRRVLIIWREMRESIYGLEKEMLQERLNRSLATAVIIILLAIAELVLASFLAPALPGQAVLSTPTLDLLATPMDTLSPQGLTSLPESLPTQTASASGCIPDQVMIASPRPGQELSGRITLVGTADIPNFGFYKYEVAPMGSESWLTISAGRDVVVDGDLGDWDTTEMIPGDYQLRLVVLDNQGQSFPPCVVPVRITG